MLVRNSEVNDAAVAIQQLEDRFNKKYKYPWVFLNDEPFNERFIQCVDSSYLLCSSFRGPLQIDITLHGPLLPASIPCALLSGSLPTNSGNLPLCFAI